MANPTPQDNLLSHRLHRLKTTVAGVVATGADMVLASVQTVTGAKTFLDGKLLLQNVANTFYGVFTNANTANRTYTLPDSSGTLVLGGGTCSGTCSGTNTGDQTYIAPRVVSATNYTTSCTIDASVTDRYFITAQAGALLFNNPSNATNGQTIIIRIKDNGTARALTWDTQFRGIIASLPNTTRISKTMYITVVYNSTDTKWDMVALADEP